MSEAFTIIPAEESILLTDKSFRKHMLEHQVERKDLCSFEGCDEPLEEYDGPLYVLFWIKSHDGSMQFDAKACSDYRNGTELTPETISSKYKKIIDRSKIELHDLPESSTTDLIDAWSRIYESKESVIDKCWLSIQEIVRAGMFHYTRQTWFPIQGLLSILMYNLQCTEIGVLVDSIPPPPGVTFTSTLEIVEIVKLDGVVNSSL